MDAGELFEYSAPPDKIFSESLARNVFQQLIMALYYCHKQGVAHRGVRAGRGGCAWWVVHHEAPLGTLQGKGNGLW